MADRIRLDEINDRLETLRRDLKSVPANRIPVVQQFIRTLEAEQARIVEGIMR